MKRFLSRSAAATLLIAVTGATSAHEGHGLTVSHWHATDTAGFALVAVLAVVAIWLSRDS